MKIEKRKQIEGFKEIQDLIHKLATRLAQKDFEIPRDGRLNLEAVAVLAEVMAEEWEARYGPNARRGSNAKR